MLRKYVYLTSASMIQSIQYVDAGGVCLISISSKILVGVLSNVFPLFATCIFTIAHLVQDKEYSRTEYQSCVRRVKKLRNGVSGSSHL